MIEECKCNTCKYREVTQIICPCIDCYDYSHYQEKDKASANDDIIRDCGEENE